MRRLTLAAMLLLAASSVQVGPAWADGPVSTTSQAQVNAPQPSDAAPPLPAEVAGMTHDGQPMAMGPCGPEKVKPDGKLDTAPHGEVYGGVGTHGYREVGADVCVPIGDNAALNIAVDSTQWGGRRH